MHAYMLESGACFNACISLHFSLRFIQCTLWHWSKIDVYWDLQVTRITSTLTIGPFHIWTMTKNRYFFLLNLVKFYQHYQLWLECFNSCYGITKRSTSTTHKISRHISCNYKWKQFSVALGLFGAFLLWSICRNECCQELRLSSKLSEFFE